MYIMKANQTINSECYSYTQSQLMSSKIRFLIDENEAMVKLSEMKQFKQMTKLQQEDYKRPYQLTSILKAEMMNLVSTTDGALIILKQSNPKIRKDKFSAFIYGLYYCKLQEDRRNKRKAHNFSDFMLFTPHKS